MSHFITLVIVSKEASAELAVDIALAPFDENKEMEPRKEVLSNEEIQRMAEHYGVKPTDLGVLALKMDSWHNAPGGVDEDGHLYYMTTYNEKSKWDWYTIGGRWAGFFKDVSPYENECLVKDYVKALKKNPKDYSVFAVVTPDGQWHEQGEMGWFGMVANRKAKKTWENTLQKELVRYKNYRAIAVDLHI